MRTSHEIALDILAYLNDLGGFDGWWTTAPTIRQGGLRYPHGAPYEIDSCTRDVITEALEKIIRESRDDTA